MQLHGLRYNYVTFTLKHFAMYLVAVAFTKNETVVLYFLIKVVHTLCSARNAGVNSPS